jgi:hypothetical protein
MLGSDLAKNAMWALWGVHLTNRLMARHGQSCELGFSFVKSARGLGHGTTFDNQAREYRVAGGFSLEEIIPVDYTPPTWIMEKKFSVEPLRQLRQMFGHRLRSRDQLRAAIAPDLGSATNRRRRHTLEMST